MTSAAPSPEPDAAAETAVALRERAQALLVEQRTFLTARVDRSFALLLLVQYAATIVAALIVAAHGRGVASDEGRMIVLPAVLLGALFTALPVGLALVQPGRESTRQMVAAGQMLMSSLLIYISGGRSETHFHVFGSLAFLAFYRDWRVLVTASAIAALDHMIGGIYWPRSTYGLAVPAPWRWLEHAGWVAFEDIFLIRFCLEGVSDLKSAAERQAALGAAHAEIEAASQSRAAELEAKVAERTAELVRAKEAAEQAS